MIDDRIESSENWKDIIKSEDWKYFVELMTEHIEHLERMAINNLKAKQHDLATENAIRADECKKILALAEGRLDNITKG